MTHKKLPIFKNAHENLNWSAVGSSNGNMLHMKATFKSLKVQEINDILGGTIYTLSCSDHHYLKEGTGQNPDSFSTI